VRRSLHVYAFLAMVAVALLSVVLAGLIIRSEASAAFADYVKSLPSPMGGGMGTARSMMMGASEQTFLAAVDRGIWIAALIAMALAALVAFAGAYYLTRPLKRLTAAVQTVAEGDLTHRVDTAGPLEVSRLGEAFNEMTASLAESEVLRSRLVADVAHELRNPLASLRAQAEGIAEGVLSSEPARLASLAEDTQQLSRLVDDLQELSAADAGRLTYRMGRIDLARLIEAETTRARTRASERVRVIADCTNAFEVTGDDGRLAQVLRNLLDNALRHTDSGEVRVTCAAQDGRVVVEVADTGEGIPAPDLPYVFERFYRADAARARDTGGSGIGLAISRRIVEDHDGRVFARNREGGGAVVGFSIPLADWTGAPAPSGSARTVRSP
jgi:two-component system sensor histidine kinase BaeS